jgi:hypothetical protein
MGALRSAARCRACPPAPPPAAASSRCHPSRWAGGALRHRMGACLAPVAPRPLSPSGAPPFTHTLHAPPPPLSLARAAGGPRPRVGGRGAPPAAGPGARRPLRPRAARQGRHQHGGGQLHQGAALPATPRAAAAAGAGRSPGAGAGRRGASPGPGAAAGQQRGPADPGGAAVRGGDRRQQHAAAEARGAAELAQTGRGRAAGRRAAVAGLPRAAAAGAEGRAQGREGPAVLAGAQRQGPFGSGHLLPAAGLPW